MDNLEEACSDLSFLKQLLKTARSIDDNIIPKLNGVTTRADRTESCQIFFQALHDSYQQRHRLIHQCIDYIDDRIDKSKDMPSTMDSIVRQKMRLNHVLKLQLESELTVESIVRSRTQAVFNSKCRGVPKTLDNIWSFGETRIIHALNISDSQDDQITRKLQITITGYKLISPEQRIYGSDGVIDPLKLQSVLTSSNATINSIVGMFKFRRNTIIMPTLRDMAVYESLQYIRSIQPTPSKHLDHQLLALLTSSMDDPATMSQTFGFMYKPFTNNPRESKVEFKRVECKIANLFDGPSTDENSSLLSFAGSSGFGHTNGTSLHRLKLNAQKYQAENANIFTDSIVDLKNAVTKYVDRENRTRPEMIQKRMEKMQASSPLYKFGLLQHSESANLTELSHLYPPFNHDSSAYSHSSSFNPTDKVPITDDILIDI
ncbi:hypothetical protein BATDEDRAFT_27119 [Batrachochytrium dendrobatidis JAM81]|uniref:Uncharacterized protein n=1 Tax=Batrachochytrium dendrobatidis (strain JAM81 / FGSC 10211) TaxID=684364 RepID=F4PA45_BATDJ|nr:uncharacterized protein BATDEDRAFT_27119 [Batrachochytrium dendrobatidis JAM81]EGF77973.1 hypothetical protein BATDEDRAFT_27119 [Batrachochytrium dendrobatidis JAM81]|eukprot:XP_006681384.1 hypothetical protein BATDEDRAFT_27119 [Batrachochytrium dendrobatidis JAM81]